MADYGARHTLMQTAAVWDLIAERATKRSSTNGRMPVSPPAAFASKQTSVPKQTSFLPERLWRIVGKLRQQPRHG